MTIEHHGNGGGDELGRQGDGQTPLIEWQPRPERHLIRHAWSFRHVDFAVSVGWLQVSEMSRPPLRIALVIDRSGSMQGDKLAMAKRAALAALDRLDERDQAAVIVFDDRIDVIQPGRSMSAAAKERVRAELSRIGARGSTALHEGWAIGCQEIVQEVAEASGLARVLLLTDGLANLGLADPERIASEAAGAYEHAGISTSTFGIGADYNEALLAPMATAGGGQFHHLRTTDDIGRAFLGELGGLLAVAVRHLCLELEVDQGVSVEVVSEYWLARNDALHYSIAIGDLLGREERHVVVRFGFPPYCGPDDCRVRARLRWLAGGETMGTGWRELRFRYADDATCNAEARDPAVMHWVGLHQSYRAQREAAQQSRSGDLAGARRTLDAALDHVAQFASSDLELQDAMVELRSMEDEVAAAPLSPLAAKERYYQAQRRSRAQRDLRAEPPKSG